MGSAKAQQKHLPRSPLTAQHWSGQASSGSGQRRQPSAAADGQYTTGLVTGDDPAVSIDRQHSDLDGLALPEMGGEHQRALFFLRGRGEGETGRVLVRVVAV